MKDSVDEVIRKAYPEITPGAKWSLVKATEEAECSLRINDIIGVTQINRATKYSPKWAQREKESW